MVGLARHADEGERGGPEIELKEPPAVDRPVVVVALLLRFREDVNLRASSGRPLVRLGHRRASAPPRRARRSSCGRPTRSSTMSSGRAGGVGDLLRREDDVDVLLAKRLEPRLKPSGEDRMAEKEPGLVDDHQRRPPVELPFDAVKEVLERGNDERPRPCPSGAPSRSSSSVARSTSSWSASKI